MIRKLYIILVGLLFGIVIVLFATIKVEKDFSDIEVFNKIYTVQNPEVLNGKNSSILWQGFYHQWDINHRLNRLGDMIDEITINDSTLEAKLMHTAASGSASDVLNYTSFFSFINTSQAVFAPSKVNLHVYGKEGNVISKKVKVKGFYSPELTKYPHAEVVLHGLDIRNSTKEELLYGNGKADKLISFKADLNNLKISNGEYEFTIDMRFNADCDSPECLRLNNKKDKWYDYQVMLGYQLIFYNDKVAMQNAEVSNTYAWEKKQGKSRAELEIHRDDLGILSKSIQGKSGFTHAIPMISSIDIDIPKTSRGKKGIKQKAVHLLSLDLALPQFSYNPLDAICTFDACLFFKNWTFKMHPLSNTFPGVANLKMGIKLMQINDKKTEIESHHISDKIAWKTNHLKQNQSTDERSVSERIFIRNL